ncbi:unnamed protein product [Rhodiola kirilowii]
MDGRLLHMEVRVSNLTRYGVIRGCWFSLSICIVVVRSG